ncbi:putative transcriptional regulator crp family [Thiomonas arsenitoxydans]|uniref:Transcriptional regulator crp family n=1 Tax=Thiomonas arsenitoxydans (strain DSM 22701 / CIP 110005 / 3As) TaxID=426114 RepID=D6CMH3_THIA3|nr:putative transcriptional regulator crp family [Thiomonas arsenitoxydans]
MMSRQHESEGVRKGCAQCHQCAIRAQCVFKHWPLEELNAVAENIDDVQYGPRQVLYEPGKRGDHVYVIRTDLVTLACIEPDGQRRISRVAKRGDVIGLESLVTQPFLHRASSVKTVRVCRIPITLFQDEDAGWCDGDLDMMKRWHRALQQADDWSCLYGGQRPVTPRMAQLILALTDPPWSETLLLPKLDDLAALLGVAMESASRALSRLRQRGWLVRLGLGRYAIERDALDAYVQVRKPLSARERGAGVAPDAKRLQHESGAATVTQASSPSTVRHRRSGGQFVGMDHAPVQNRHLP